MTSLDEIGGPSDEERELVDTVTRALDSCDRLGIVPFVDKETDERVMFLVAVREGDDEEGEDGLSLHPIGPLYQLEETMERFEMPEEFSA
jgi:hypothetical protein